MAGRWGDDGCFVDVDSPAAPFESRGCAGVRDVACGRMAVGDLVMPSPAHLIADALGEELVRIHRDGFGDRDLESPGRARWKE